MRRSATVMLAVTLVFPALPSTPIDATTIPPGFAPGRTTRESVNTSGTPVGGSNQYQISANGRYVVFTSSSSNVVPGASGLQVYRHDHSTGVTELVSVDRDGHALASGGFSPTVSADGRYVAYHTFDANIVAGDTNGALDVFVRDMQTGTTALATANASGVISNRGGSLASRNVTTALSDDGRYVVFSSVATNLLPDTINSFGQVYRKDLQTGDVVRVSVDNLGKPGNDHSSDAVISGNGQVVAFTSQASNFSPLVTNHSTQAYVHDFATGLTTIEAVTTAGLPNSFFPSTSPVLSFDGRFVAFETQAVMEPRDHDSFTWDVYLRDRVARTTKLASLSANTFTFADSRGPTISSDGRYVGFHSIDRIVVPNDTNNQVDIFLYDRDTEGITLVSLNNAGQQTNAGSQFPSLSSDGAHVLFLSAATNLVTSPPSTGGQLYLRDLAANTTPVLTLEIPGGLYAGDTLTASGSFADPDQDDSWTATVDYGEGGGAVPLPLAADKTFQLSHRYPRPGSFTVRVTVTDSRNGQGIASFSLEVKRRSLVFVPGIFGSRLVAQRKITDRAIPDGHGGIGHQSADANEQVWLNLTRALNPLDIPDDYYDLLKLHDDGLTPYAPEIEPNGELVKDLSVLGLKQKTAYDDVEAFFTGEGGYTRGRDFFVFTYDWRRSSADVARDLDESIRQIRLVGSPRVDIVAHSLGGLVVRSYLLNGTTRESAAQVVMLGSPLLGTPAMEMAPLGGICVPPVYGPCLIGSSEVRDVTRTLPSAFDLGPSREYYRIFDGGLATVHPSPYVDLRVIPDAEAPADFSTLRSRFLEAGVPSALLDRAELYHADDDRWTANIPAGTTLTLMSGSGYDTPGQVIERRILRFFPTLPGEPSIVVLKDYVDFQNVDGDSLVVTESASLKDSGANGPNVRRYYVLFSHQELTWTEDLRSVVTIVRETTPSSPKVSITPFRRTGELIVSTHSPLELLVTDDAGRRAGGLSGDESFVEIPGSRDNRLGETRALAVPSAGHYNVTLRGTGRDVAIVRLREVENGLVVREVLFPKVPTLAGSRFAFTRDSTGQVSDLEVDLNGDGVVDSRVTPLVLTGAAAEDMTAPSITVQSPLVGQATVGAVPIGWQASDSGSGVAESFALIDRAGPTPLRIGAPGGVAVTPGSHTVEFVAEDRAANGAMLTRTFLAYAYEWDRPISGDGTFDGNVGRTIPVKFRVMRPDGTLVEEGSVTLIVRDAAQRTVVGPLRLAPTPNAGIKITDGTYHADVGTRGLPAGDYEIVVRFDSPTLVGALVTALTLR